MLLHTVSASPYSTRRLDDAVNACVPGDALLLLGDAVHAAVARGQAAVVIGKRSDIAWYAIDEDCRIRGLGDDALHPLVQRIDYAAFVELTISADSTIAW
jgi:tRNA 2-thiouridine synthesizing protein B